MNVCRCMSIKYQSEGKICSLLNFQFSAMPIFVKEILENKQLVVIVEKVKFFKTADE